MAGRREIRRHLTPYPLPLNLAPRRRQPALAPPDMGHRPRGLVGAERTALQQVADLAIALLLERTRELELERLRRGGFLR